MKHRILVVANRLPEYDKESGSRRIYHMIHILMREGWRVSFGADTADGGERYLRHLQQMGVETFVPIRPQLEEALAEAHYDVALLAFWENAELLLPRIRAFSPSTRIVVDMVDLHLLREARNILLVEREAPRGLLDSIFGSATAREINTYALADAVLSVSEKEADLVNDLTGSQRLAHVVPDGEETSPSLVPLGERNGMLFVGNFWHAPNRNAIEFLIREILPLVDRRLRARHPMRVVGHQLDDSIRALADDLPEVEMVGWVPSLAPYFERARISVVPLLWGAGIKRKLLQSLMAGTPVVSTSVGAEGLELVHGEHALIADDPESFATAIELLLRDGRVWRKLARNGRSHVLNRHGLTVTRDRFAEVLQRVMERPAKPLRHDPRALVVDGAASREYGLTVDAVQGLAGRLPFGAVVDVASRGDPALVSLDGCLARHFPEADGQFIGRNPADSAEAIEHLERSRDQGADVFVLPGTAFWWLGYYAEFHQHLEQHYERLASNERCIAYRLSERVPLELPAPEGGASYQPLRAEDVAAVRPCIDPGALREDLSAAGGRVVVAGVYLAGRPTNIEDIHAQLAVTRYWDVEQRWIALGGSPPSDAVREVTIREFHGHVPKFALLNSLLSDVSLDESEYIVVMDDDVVVPEGFLDCVLALQHELEFVVAQPARTSNSYIDHPITEKQRGVLARRTQFVEIGPVFSVHRSAFDFVFPFDLTSPMGWGYENVWAYEVGRRGLKMGILDAVPVDHSLRRPVAHYSWHDANRQRDRYLARNPHLPIDKCCRVLDLVPLQMQVMA
jgi:glycosyltransferase involved in cell wall biosynthesis